MGDLPSSAAQTLLQSAVSEAASQIVVSVPPVGSDPAQKQEAVSPKAVPSAGHGVLCVTPLYHQLYAAKP